MNFFTRVLLLMSTLTLITLSLQASLSVTESHENVSCFGGSNGSIDITVSGGNAPYSYLWNGGSTNEDRINLPQGTYSLTITDNVGVSASVSVVISQPSAITTSRIITDVYCGGDSTGAVDFTVSGGTPGYTYLWSNGSILEDIAYVPAANYYITITDANGCIKVDSADVIQPPGMVISKSITNATCNSSNGAINLTVQYGIPGYSFLWNDGVTSEDRAGLPVGADTVTITDNSGCVKIETATVSQAPGAMIINRTSVNPSCAAGSNGAITITAVIGSVGPYTFVWADGPTSQNRTGLSAGIYSVTATSSVGCTASATASLTEPTPLNVSLNPVPVSCNGGNNGAIISSVSGGTSPYNYLWNDGAFTQNRTSLPSGNYSVLVTDNRGCTATATTSVAQPLLALSATAIPSPLACIGGPTGSVITSVSGGTAPYSYWWGMGFITPDRLNVVAGTYTVTATDANGCTAVALAIIPPYTPMNATVTNVTHNSCYGGSMGMIDISVVDGSMPYNFVWSNGETTEDIDSVSTGMYTVIITDQHACIVTLSAIVNQPNPDITINSTVTDVTCFGYSDGTITVNAVNGSTPYSYLWGNGTASTSLSGLSSGSYSVTATDANTCSTAISITVSEPTTLSVSNVSNDVLCYGDSSGSIYLNVTGSFPPYTYQWNEGGNTQNRLHLPIGSYTVTVVDNHFCSTTSNAIINQPDEIIFSYTITNTSCFGGADGGINVSASGGHQPYQYNWSNGLTSATIQNLSAGTYTLTLTDSVGCIKILTDTIKEPQEIIITATTTNAGCGGVNTGTITLTISGEQLPLTFDWGSGITSQNRAGLASGNYSVIVTDSIGCTATQTATVGQSSDMIISYSVTDATCYGTSNGAIDITVANGTSPYTFDWGGVFQQNRIALSSGNYSVTITDYSGCSMVETITVNEPAVILVSSSVTNASCNGGNNGTINLTITGISPFTFDWGNNITTQNRINLTAGTYSVTVTDSSGCSIENTSVVSQSGNLAISGNVIDVLCYGDSTGSASISVSGGVAPYSFDWGNGISDSVRTNLSAGSYIVTVSDAAACSLQYNAVVDVPTPLQIATLHNNVSCSGMNDGEIFLNISGGVPPYNFIWNDGVTLPNRSNLSSGTYTVSVVDANSCEGTTVVFISEPTPLTVAVSQTNLSCANHANGTISLTANGGTGNYTFAWNDGNTNAFRSGLIGAGYIFTVSDVSNCSFTDSVIITEPSPVIVTYIVTNPLCYGDSTGSINLNVSGGAGGYSYLWNSGVSTQHLFNVAAGNYSVSVSDANSCEVSASAVVNQPVMLIASEVHTNLSCNGGNDGAIDLTANGTGTLSYLWNNGSNSEDRSNLVAGIYTVTVSDTNSCSISISITITEPDSLVLTESHTDFYCSSNQGAIDLSVNGGAAPYTFDWTNSAISEDINNLSEGSYTVRVTDNNSCTASLSVTILSAQPLTSTHTKVDLLCYGASNGAIDLSVLGGTLPYHYLWSNGSSLEDLNNIPSGIYNVVVTDAANCTAAELINISQPTEIEVSRSVDHVSCFGGNNGAITLSVSGGATPFSIIWSTTDSVMSITSLSAGLYTALVTDSNGCMADSVLVVIQQPDDLVLVADVNDISCSNRADGSIYLNVQGGAPPYSFLWSNLSSVPDMSYLSSGTYSATVTDNNGCVDSITEVIDVVAPIQLEASLQNTPCLQVQRGVIDLTVTGGTPTYTYQWNDFAQSEDRANLSEGNYAVTVIDSRGCSAQSSFAINADYELQINASPSVTITLGETANLLASVNTNHANTYLWSPGLDVTCDNCLNTSSSPRATTLYTIYAVDANGCSASDTLTVTVETVTDFFLPNVFTPNKDGANDTWEMYGNLEGVTFLDVMVFNRWGEKVFSSNNHHFAWDGTYKGEDAPTGVYVYAMKVVFANGESRNDIKGSITLLR